MACQRPQSLPLSAADVHLFIVASLAGRLTPSEHACLR